MFSLLRARPPERNRPLQVPGAGVDSDAAPAASGPAYRDILPGANDPLNFQ